jgi:phosphinothricin acetyltransferase
MPDQPAAFAYTIAPFARSDGAGIVAVFNHFVRSSFAAYPVRPVGDEFVERLQRMAGEYPVLTVKDEKRRVIGFGLLHAFHPADSFRRTAEIGYFLDPGVVGRGIGTALLERLIERARAMGIRTILASISSRNDESLAFHRRRGFVEVGRFRRIGEKFGEDFDVVYMQRDI